MRKERKRGIFFPPEQRQPILHVLEGLRRQFCRCPLLLESHYIAQAGWEDELVLILPPPLHDFG